MELQNTAISGKVNDDLTTVTVDAVHPRLLDKKEEEFALCEDCGVIFVLSLNALRRHFLTVTHRNNVTCLYCRGPIYRYIKGPEGKVEQVANYHECTPNMTSDGDLAQRSGHVANGKSC